MEIKTFEMKYLQGTKAILKDIFFHEGTGTIQSIYRQMYAMV